MLRGQYAPQVDVSCLKDAALYPAWLYDPVVVAATSRRFRKYEMTSTMLSADQVRCRVSGSLLQALHACDLSAPPNNQTVRATTARKDGFCRPVGTATGCLSG